MEIIKSKIKHNLNIDEYIEGNSCFVDIETTGFSRDKDMIYLIGLLYQNKSEDIWILEQYFANTKQKEDELIDKFIDHIKEFHNIITYNGDAFDIPFINHRAEVFNLNKKVDSLVSFDLYRYIRSNKDFLDLKDLKLKTIEESLGYYREDIYSGYDCISFYENYIKTKNMDLKNKVLKHNYDDLVHMLDILDILDVIEEKKSINFNFMDNDNTFIIDDIENIKNTIIIKGNLKNNIQYDIKNFQLLYSIESFEKEKLIIKLPVKEGYITNEDKALFLDLNEYDIKLHNYEAKKYGIPDNIYCLQIKNNLMIPNIKKFLSFILNNLLSI